MNIFKGLLFLHGYVSPSFASEFADAPAARKQYGARTAADELAAPLGNASQSRRWFGPAPAGGHASQAGCIAGGCG